MLTHCRHISNFSKLLADQSAPAGFNQTDLTLIAEDQPELGVLKETDESASYFSPSSLLPTILLEFSLFYTTYPKYTNLVRLLTFLKQAYHNPSLIFTQTSTGCSFRSNISDQRRRSRNTGICVDVLQLYSGRVCLGLTLIHTNI